MPDDTTPTTPNLPRYPGDPAAGGEVKKPYVDPNKTNIGKAPPTGWAAAAAAEAERRKKLKEETKPSTSSAVQREALKQ